MELNLLTFIWFLYSYLEGFRESYYWWFKSVSGKEEGFNIHTHFLIQRGVLFIMICYILDFDLLKITIFPLTFSFIHNGSYYLNRSRIAKSNNEVDPYPKGFFDQSFSSTALTTRLFTPVNRTILFIIGIFFYILNFI
jgi:hypothetical protein